MGLLKKLAILGAGLATWYTFNGAPNNIDEIRDYPLPGEIVVEETKNVTYTLRYVSEEDPEMGSVKVVDVNDIDFSEDFIIETDRYTLDKRKDIWLSRTLGKYVLSIPQKLFFWDSDVSHGVDEKRAMAALSMLESDDSIDNLTVRLGHNRLFYDTGRLFFDDEVKDRNPWLARVLMGLPGTLVHELGAEFFRGDYYNPFTKTVVNYSNIESILAHEIGHHQDYERFSTDWAYNLLSVVPGGSLYKEAQASLNAKDILDEHGDDWQFNRYLIPAYLTYILSALGTAKAIHKKFTE